EALAAVEAKERAARKDRGSKEPRNNKANQWGQAKANGHASGRNGQGRVPAAVPAAQALTSRSQTAKRPGQAAVPPAGGLSKSSAVAAFREAKNAGRAFSSGWSTPKKQATQVSNWKRPRKQEVVPADLAPFEKAFLAAPESLTEEERQSMMESRETLEITVEMPDELADVFPPISCFDDLRGILPDYAFEGIAEMGIETPMPIQAQALPLALAGLDVVGVAKTGSGKTLAYLLPALTHIEVQEPLQHGVAAPIALILAPTRELAVQIADMSRAVVGSTTGSAHPNGLSAGVLYGGGHGSKGWQVADIRNGAHIVAATPGRLLDVMDSGEVSLERVTYFVLDEADRMLECGFEDQVGRIGKTVRQDRQTLFFSATWPTTVQQMAQVMCSSDLPPVCVMAGQRGDREKLPAVMNTTARVLWLTFWFGAGPRVYEIYIVQNEMDPCIFMLTGENDQEVKGVIFTHVDDLLLLCNPELMVPLQQELSGQFPVDKWQDSEFEYLGCSYKFEADRAVISQRNYADNRVEAVSIMQGQADGDNVTPEQKEENRTGIGSLSWLSKQTRPDLQFGVCQRQRTQNNPTVADLKATNRLVKAAKEGRDEVIVLRCIPEGNLAFFAYHDAAWGNVDAPDRAEGDEQWYGEHKLASQLGQVVLAVDRQAAKGKPTRFSVLDWRSKASQRVCRSTFAGETMAACEAMENVLFLRALFVSMTGAGMSREAARARVHVHMFTGCKSLFDHAHREGTPKAPADKRLAVDLADLRSTLMEEARAQWREISGTDAELTPERPCRPPLHWLPSEDQLADFLTKSMNPERWRSTMAAGELQLALRDRSQVNS
ncbi:RH20, partial [Symbiodinium microadriaticum]